MSTTRQHVVALTLCALALASVTVVATAPAAAHTGAGNDDGDASNATELDAIFEHEGVDGCPPEAGINPLTLTANRAPFDVTVTAADLDADHLFTVFDDELNTDDPAITNLTRTDDGVRMRVRDRNATITANFSDAYIPTDDHEIRFETGGGATADDVVTVLESDCIDALILRGGSDETARSGVVDVPIQLHEIDEARVRLTGEDLSLSVDVEDVNDDGLVTLVVNTHLVGRNAPNDGHGSTYWTREGLTVGEPVDSLTEITLDDAPGGDDPLPAGEYDVAVRKNDHTLDTHSLSVTETAVADFESWTGQSDTLENATAGDLRRAIGNDTLADDDSVANGSALVYEIESSSLFGPLEAAATRYDGSDRYAKAFLDVAADRELSTVPGNPVRFGIAGDSGARIELRDTYRNDGLVVARDYLNRTLYVGLRTDRLVLDNGTVRWSGQEFEANLTIHDEIDRQPVRFSDANASTAPPSTPSTATPDRTVDQPTSPTEQAESPETETRVSTTDETAAPETTGPSTDAGTEDSPAAARTTTGDGAGFGVAAPLAALAVICSLVLARFRS
ncbi:hypothetical protein [Halorientalis halophila]|uniref:hypothetical protein n=1 Tax=Halorientalis halophila TaxID=3108499 RepID=UPI00300B72B8